MSNAYILKEFDGGAEASTLTAQLSSVGTSFTLVNGSSFPSGSSPFVVVVNRGLANEEKIICSARSTNTFTVLERGYDGSTAQVHNAGSVVEHCLDAFTIEQANRYANLQTTKGDLVGHNGTTTQRFAVGSNNQVLVADSAQTNGIKWSTVGTDSLAASAVTVAKLASAVQNLLVPAGTVVATVSTSADTGWLLLNGQTVASADTTYPALWAVAPASWKSGTSLVLPNAANRAVFGQGSTALGGTGGSNTVTIASGNLPVHTHTIDHNHPSTSATVTDPSHNHVVPGAVNNFVFQSGSYSSNNYLAGFSANNDGIIDGLGAGAQGGASLYFGSAVNGSYTGISVSVDLPNFTGSSGNGGFANSALTVTNAHLALNFQIKAH